MALYHPGSGSERDEASAWLPLSLCGLSSQTMDCCGPQEGGCALLSLPDPANPRGHAQMLVSCDIQVLSITAVN